MKAAILYDLAAPVEMSQEDAEVVALVNRGRATDDRLWSPTALAFIWFPVLLNPAWWPL